MTEEQKFIKILLYYLKKLGINEIDTNELALKLYPYFKNPEFEKCFSGIRILEHKALDLREYLKEEENRGRIERLDETNDRQEHIHIRLNYPGYYPELESATSEILPLITQIAEELALRHELESPTFNIYGEDPNSFFNLISFYTYTQRLITDGDVKVLSKQVLIPPVKFIDRVRNRNTIWHVKISDASYVLKQNRGLDFVGFSLYTKILERTKLERMKEIAMEEKNREDSVIGSRIRKIKL